MAAVVGDAAGEAGVGVAVVGDGDPAESTRVWVGFAADPAVPMQPESPRAMTKNINSQAAGLTSLFGRFTRPE